MQEALLEASQDLSDYLRDRPLPFHAWLRQYVNQRISKLHRHHLGAHRRSIRREEAADWHLPEESSALLADRLIARESSPSQRILREELRLRMQAALDRLGPRDREVKNERLGAVLESLERAGRLCRTPAGWQRRDGLIERAVPFPLKS